MVCVTRLVDDTMLYCVSLRAEAVTVCVTSGAFVHAVDAAGVLHAMLVFGLRPAGGHILALSRSPSGWLTVVLARRETNDPEPPGVHLLYRVSVSVRRRLVDVDVAVKVVSVDVTVYAAIKSSALTALAVQRAL